MNRIDRLFGILVLVQSKKYVPAEKIADKFQMSIRTVYRDVKALCELGIPISFEKQKGYFVVQGYFLPPVSFSMQEANALLLMETLASGFSDKSTLSHYSSALNKVKNILRSSQKEALESLDKNIRIQLPKDLKQNFDLLPIIQEAIVLKHILDLEYKNKKEEISKRLIEPIGIVFYALNWHLIAWCHLRNANRDFRLSHIQKLFDTGSPFIKSDHIGLGDYMQLLPVNY